MAISPPSKISGATFRKMAAGSKGYLSTSATRALKSAGLGETIYKKSVGQQEAVKALRVLQKEGTVSKGKIASEMWQAASVNQKKKEMAVTEERKQRHLRSYLAMDISEQLKREELENEMIKYPKRSFGSLNEKLAYEKKVREQQIAEEKSKRGKLFNAGVKPQKPQLPNLPDMPIG